ncbi:dihydrofolate reductase [Corynebacterium auriscanis]|uniref:dihydrofolate reductase n=1 Tax=Corynebacterium auriscanis TaxID=99807 RepID=UPI003CE94835
MGQDSKAMDRDTTTVSANGPTGFSQTNRPTGLSQTSRPTGFNQGDYPVITSESVTAALQQLDIAREDVEIGMIWAQTTAGVIGDGKDMPWYLPEDLEHFKQATVNYPVVMGRTSWEALDDGFRPLPRRENYVVTRNESYEAPGGHVFTSLDHAIAAAAQFQLQHNTDRPALVWILGGGQIYAQCMAVADRVVITEIDMSAPARFRVHAPAVDEPDFTLQSASPWRVSQKGHTVDGEGELKFRICEWTNAHR